MIMTCSRCKNDFLTEADPFITVPLSNGYALYCTCEITKLKSEMENKDKIIRKLSGCLAHYIESEDMIAKDSCDKNSIRLLNELSQKDTDNE